MPHPLIIATSNQHKLQEIAAILRELLPAIEFDLLCSADFEAIPEPEETGDTFEANALIKARAYAQVTGLLTLADDSGLEVDALDGRPGIYSARYAASSAERIAKLLGELAGVPAPQRTARFVSVVALGDGTGSGVTFRGTVEGRIGAAPRGVGGFGYDPVFELHDPHSNAALQGRTLAELAEAEKNTISHRARALAAAVPTLAQWFAASTSATEKL